MRGYRLLIACRIGALSAACLFCGCTGSAAIHFVSLHPTEIDPPPTEVWQFDAQECYWWVDEAGKLNLTWTHKKSNLLLGKFGLIELNMSLVLNEPPAGSGRNYRVRGNTLRAVFTSALQRQKLQSQSGIVAVMVDDENHIHGSFRLWVWPKKELQFFSFIPATSGRLLCFGTFRAVKDEPRGAAVRSYCESNAGARGVPKKSGPTTRPAD